MDNLQGLTNETQGDKLQGLDDKLVDLEEKFHGKDVKLKGDKSPIFR